MKITFLIMSQGKEYHVTGKGKQSACMKFCGRRVKPAIELKLIESIEKLAQAQPVDEKK